MDKVCNQEDVASGATGWPRRKAARPATSVAADETIEPHDTEEIAEARWGTIDELAGPLRERLLATGRAFWRYRVALHDAAIDAIDS